MPDYSATVGGHTYSWSAEHDLSPDEVRSFLGKSIAANGGKITRDMPMPLQLAIANASPQTGHLKEGGTYRPPGRKASVSRGTNRPGIIDPSLLSDQQRTQLADQGSTFVNGRQIFASQLRPFKTPTPQQTQATAAAYEKAHPDPLITAAEDVKNAIAQAPSQAYTSVTGLSREDAPYAHAALDFVGGFAAFPAAITQAGLTTAQYPVGTVEHLGSTAVDVLQSANFFDPNISGPERFGRALNAAALLYGGVEGVRGYLKTPEGIAKFAALKDKLKVSDHGANVALDSLGRDIQHGQPVHPKENIHAVPIKETGGVGLRKQDAVGEGLGGQNRPVEAAPESQPPAAPQQAQEPVAVPFIEGAGNTEAPVSFTTSKGSTYTVHPDGTTTRNKSFHPEHGAEDQGLQPRSEKTFYVSAEDAQKLGEFQTSGSKKAVAEVPGSPGSFGVKYLDGPNAGKFEKRTVVKGASAPTKGATPVELFEQGRRVHFGNEITDVGNPEAKQAPASKPETANAKVEPWQMTADERAQEARSQDIAYHQERLSDAKTGKDVPNRFSNGAKSKASLVRMRQAELDRVNELPLSHYHESWQTLIDAKNAKADIPAERLDEFSDVAKGAAPSLRAQAEGVLDANGYRLRDGVYTQKPDEPPPTEVKPTETPKGKHPDIYRETSAARYWDRSYSGEDTYWATHPDLALGQGENKGVLIRFRPKDSAILRENPKPGIDPTGIKELVVGKNQPTNSGRLPGDVVSVTIKKGTKLPVEMKLNLQTFSKEGNPNRVYTKETLPNGDVVFHTKLSEGFKPDAKPAESEADKAASAPPASSKLDAFKQSLRDSIAQDEADLKKGLGNNPERGATNIPQHVAVVAKKALLYALETGEKVWKAVERFGKTLTPAERKMALDHAKELHDKNGGELVADHFDPLEPQIKSIIADTKGGFAAEIKQTFNAPAMSRLAGVAARTLRASMGRISQAVQIREVALDKISKVFDKMSEPDRLDFIDKMESGDSQPSPELQQVADVLRSQLDIQRDRIQSLGKGWLDDYIENYFPHIWETKGKGGMPAFLERLVPKRRSLTGRGEFLMQRSVPTIKDGIDSGLVPVSTNPVELARLKLRSMDQFLLGHQAIMELKSEGLLKFHPADYALPKGWSVIDDKFSTIFNKEDVGKIDGKWIAPDPVVRVVNNFLSPGLRGKSWYKAMQGANNALLQARLGLSGFHAGFVTMDTTISKMSLGIQKLGEGDVSGALKDFAATPTAPITTFLKGKKGIEQYLSGADAGPVIDALIEGGLRVKQDPFYSQYAAETFSRLVKDRRYGKALLKAPQAALHLASKPIMEGLVPRMKVGAAMDMAEFELKRLGPDATRDEIREAMAKVVDSVDNRLGQLNYDNLFWDRTTKDVTALLMQSSGWNIGTVRELGGGARDVFSVGRRTAGGPRITSRTAYTMATAAVPAIYGAIYMYLRTGHGPQSLRDYYQPRTGVTDDNGNEERVSLPSYAKDVLSYATHPLETLKNKESPLLSMSQELLANEDYYRDPIRKTDNPLYMQALDIAQYVAQGFTPFAYRKWSEQTPERRTEQFFGIAKAPKDTSDVTQGEQYYRQGLGDLSKAKELGYSRSGSHQPSRPPVSKPKSPRP